MKDLLFDLDGTLIDSSECIYAVYTKLFTELNMPDPPIEVKRTFIGPPVETVMKNYVPASELKRVVARFRTLYEYVDLKKTNKVYDGVEEMLATLKKKGKRLFVASTKNEQKAKAIIRLMNLENYFDGVYGSRDDIGRSSKLDVLNALAKENDVDKTDCILIGDTHFDAEGAQEFGIPCAIVTYGFGQPDKLEAYPVYQTFATPQAVANAL